MKYIQKEDDLLHFTKSIQELLDDAKIDAGITLLSWDETQIHYEMKLYTQTQFGLCFKIPNLLNYNLGIEEADIYDTSGVYTDWLIVIPNK